MQRSVRGGHKEAYQASQATSEEQTQLDQLHLQLQNILYEKIHIEKEIQRCKKFRCGALRRCNRYSPLHCGWLALTSLLH